MTVILVFLGTHWVLAAFVQVFFLHRYAAHRQFTMSMRTERFFYVMTYLVLGSSYQIGRASCRERVYLAV